MYHDYEWSGRRSPARRWPRDSWRFGASSRSPTHVASRKFAAMCAWRRSGRAAAILLAVLVAASSCGGGEEPDSDGEGEQAQELGQLLEPGDAQELEEGQDLADRAVVQR